MTEFIQHLVGNDFLATVLMSFFPLIELKGGIVFARGAGLDFFYSLLLAYAGSTLVFFPIYFLLKPILNLIKKVKIFSKIAYKIEGYFAQKAESAVKESEVSGDKKKSATYLKQLGVFIFVAVPIPVTGVWTGTAIAVFLGLKFKEAVLPVCVGNLIAGLIISILAEICLTIWTIQILDYILYGLFALAIILLIVVIIKIAKSKPQASK